jgi:hypothetical protein
MIPRPSENYSRQSVAAFGKTLANSVLFSWILALPMAGLAADTLAPALPVVKLAAGISGLDVQKALDLLPDSGGMVDLPAGIINVSEPIVLRRNDETLCGAGASTILFLADGANCPVVILGQPVNHPQQTIKGLCLSDLFIDGNRLHQQRELWRLQGEGSEIRNNGITVQDVSDSIIEGVTSARCRSGGLVTTLGVRRLTVRDFTSFDNQFDGLACYLTMDSMFTKLFLHNNPGAGISLDLAFNHNVVANAVLAANDLGIFMRSSRNNQFADISIRQSHHYGVFMAQSWEKTIAGLQPALQTQCTDNCFTNLAASQCGGAAFRINDLECTNNIIVSPRFIGDLAGLSLARPDLLGDRVVLGPIQPAAMHLVTAAN